MIFNSQNSYTNGCGPNSQLPLLPNGIHANGYVSGPTVDNGRVSIKSLFAPNSRSYSNLTIFPPSSTARRMVEFITTKTAHS